MIPDADAHVIFTGEERFSRQHDDGFVFFGMAWYFQPRVRRVAREHRRAVGSQQADADAKPGSAVRQHIPKPAPEAVGAERLGDRRSPTVHELRGKELW